MSDSEMEDIKPAVTKRKSASQQKRMVQRDKKMSMINKKKRR